MTAGGAARLSVGLCAAALLALGAAAPGQEKAPELPLGEAICEYGCEFRLPAGAKVNKRVEDKQTTWYQWDPPGSVGGAILFWAAPGEPDPRATLRDNESRLAAEGGKIVSRSARFDPRTGASLWFITEFRAKDPPSAMAAYYFNNRGRTCMFNFDYTIVASDAWRPAIARVLASFRVRTAPTGWLDPPDPPEKVEEPGLSLTFAQAIPPPRRKPVVEDLRAALALARELTGGPEPPNPIRVHVFPDESFVKERMAGAPYPVPAATYIPEGRLLVTHARDPKPSPEAFASRFEAVLAAYRDAWLGTPHGLVPWLEAALREGARAARRKGEKATLERAASPHASWLKKGWKKAAWPAVGDVLRGDPAKLEFAQDTLSAYVLGLLLAATQSKDERIAGLLPRYFATFRDTCDADRALAAALEGVDFPKLHAEAVAALKG
ncbi:MAG: hypothetical protein L0216_01370 [Planctomycetales bacterium]|nr:hypothetical protein [Planctomycetales bacterium]